MANKKTSTILKRVLRWSIFISVVLFGLLLCGLILLTLPPGERQLRQFSEAQLSQLLGYSVEIGDLETDLLQHIRANQINIFSAEGAREKPLFHLRSARLEYNLWDIISQPLRIQSLTLDSLYINIQRDSSGHFDLPDQFYSQKSDSTTNDSSWQFRLAKLSLTNSMIEYEDRQIPLVGRLYDLNVALSSPDMDHYRFQVEADSIYLIYRDEPFTVMRTKMSGAVSGKSIQLDTLFARLPGLDLTGNALAKPDSTPIPLTGEIRLCGTLQPLARQLANYLPAQLLPIAGEMDSYVSISGNTDSPRLDLKSEITSLRIADVEVRRASAHLKWENQKARIEQFRFELWDGSLAGNGELTLDSLLTHSLNLRLETIDFYKLWESGNSGTSPLVGKVSGEFVSQGSHLAPEKLEISSSLSLQNAMFNAQVLDEISTEVIVHDGQARLSIRHGENQLLADIDIQDRKPQGEIKAEIPDISPIVALFGFHDFTGSANFASKFFGSFDPPEFTIEVAGSDIVFWNFPADTVVGHLVYQDGQFLIEDSYISGKLTEIDSLHPPFDLTGLGGEFEYQGSVSGPLNNLKGKLTTDLRQPVFMDYAFDKGNLQLSINDSTLFLDSFRLYKDSLQIEVSGEYNISADQIHGQLALSSRSENGDTTSAVVQFDDKLTFDFDFADSTRWLIGLRGTDIDLRNLNFFLEEGKKISGQSTFDLRGTGSLQHPHLIGQLNIRNGEIRLRSDAEPIRNFAMQIVLADSQLQVKNISAEIAEIPVGISGEIMKARENRTFAALDLMMLNRKILEGSGTISPDSIDYELKIQNLDLSLFQPFAPQIERLDGSLNSTLSIRGKRDDPLILGNLDIDDLSVKHQLLTSPMNRGMVRLRFDLNQVKLDTVFLAMNEGYISAFGILEHDLGKPVLLDLQLIARDLHFAEPENYIVNLKSAIFNYKTLGSLYSFEGDIILGDNRFIRKIQAADYFNLAREQMVATLEGPSVEPLDLLSSMKNSELVSRSLPQAFQQTQLTIRLHDSDSLWVNNNIAKIRMGAELELIGTPIKPSLAGRLSIQEGEVTYLDRVFKVIEGTLDFSDPERANLIVNLEAETKSKTLEEIGDTEYTITLVVTGPLDDFDYHLTSDPPLEESDIISLLTIGVTSDQLSSTQSQDGHIVMSDALKQRMEMLASQQITGNITDFTSNALGQHIGLDRLGVTGNVFDLNKARLMASKKIDDRLEMKYTTSFKKLNDFELEANYRLWKYLFLEGTTNQKNESKADLKFRLKFK